MKITDFENLLFEFNALPKNINNITYLELCQYPSRRFEEICSRLLSFFFLPTNEHNYNNLFLNSLIELLPNNKNLAYNSNRIKVIEEENAEGKRIDLVIVADNFVIGIENKISVALYNPLDIYRKRLSDYKKEHTICIVLSLRKIQKKHEKALMEKNGFINILYEDLFKKIKQRIGFYLNEGNDRYLFFLNDFITTLENMENNNILNPSLTDFFYENSDQLDELSNLYSEFNKRIRKIQYQSIQSVKEELSLLTGQDWFIWEDWDLYFQFIVNDYKLGIETNYKKTRGNPLGEFDIFITTWELKSWNFFKDSLISLFPNIAYNIEGGRAILNYEILKDADNEQIIFTLKELFEKIKEKISLLQ